MDQRIRDAIVSRAELRACRPGGCPAILCRRPGLSAYPPSSRKYESACNRNCQTQQVADSCRADGGALQPRPSAGRRTVLATSAGRKPTLWRQYGPPANARPSAQSASPSIAPARLNPRRPPCQKANPPHCPRQPCGGFKPVVKASVQRSAQPSGRPGSINTPRSGAGRTDRRRFNSAPCRLHGAQFPAQAPPRAGATVRAMSPKPQLAHPEPAARATAAPAAVARQSSSSARSAATPIEQILRAFM